MPIIQININFPCSLAEYYVKIKSGWKDFSAFGDRCPLCGGKDCPRFLGFYYREVVDERGVFYKFFPIMRFKCRRKGHKNVDEATFSLLPSSLIPYSRYSIPFVIRVMKLWHCEDHSINEVLDRLAMMNDENFLCISPTTLYAFDHYVYVAIEKLRVTGYVGEVQESIKSHDTRMRLRSFLDFLSYDGKIRIRDPSIIAHRFYQEGGGFLRNSVFLFGVPSQFRR